MVRKIGINREALLLPSISQETKKIKGEWSPRAFS